MLTPVSKIIHADGTTMIVFQGHPYVRLTWALTGVGTLSNVDDFTDDLGLAKVTFTPLADDQTVTVSVTYAP